MILKKLNNSHYVILSDEKTLSNNRDWYLGHPDYNTLHQWNMPKNSKHKNKQIWINKVLYSTQPLEEVVWWERETRKSKLGFDNIKPLSLSEVEEAIYGYSTYELFKKIDGTCKKDEYEHWLFKEGFKAHQELVKDKLFTIENMKIAIQMAKEKEKNGMITYEDKWNEDEILRELLPKTEWDIEFIDSKIKLI